MRHAKSEVSGLTRHVIAARTQALSGFACHNIRVVVKPIGSIKRQRIMSSDLIHTAMAFRVLSENWGCLGFSEPCTDFRECHQPSLGSDIGSTLTPEIFWFEWSLPRCWDDYYLPKPPHCGISRNSCRSRCSLHSKKFCTGHVTFLGVAAISRPIASGTGK